VPQVVSSAKAADADALAGAEARGVHHAVVVADGDRRPARIVRTIEPLLGEQELRLVVQLVCDRNEPAVIERS
jgi:hypothetical protein